MGIWWYTEKKMLRNTYEFRVFIRNIDNTNKGRLNEKNIY